MNQAFSPQQVICRPAVERDLQDIEEFCKTIWGGHDYVPQVMEGWLQDPLGIFAVAEYEGHTIACSKVTLLARGQWWLEGFRVDPDYQGRRVGSLIHHYVDRWWLERGGGVLRLMTNSKNKSVHHLCEETGFIRLFEVRGYKAAPIKGQVDMFTSAVASDNYMEKVAEFILTSPSLAITNRIVDFGWRCVRATHNALTDLFADFSSLENNFFWWRNGEGLLVVWDDFDADQKESIMGIGVLACELEELPAFLVDVRHLAAEQGRTSVFWIVPAHEPIEQALNQAGYSSDWENTAYIFEKTHPRNK